MQERKRRYIVEQRMRGEEKERKSECESVELHPIMKLWFPIFHKNTTLKRSSMLDLAQMRPFRDFFRLDIITFRLAWLS